MTTVKARCVVEIEVECEGSWNPNVTMEQINAQGIRSATEQVQNLLKNEDVRDSMKLLSIRSIQAWVTNSK